MIILKCNDLFVGAMHASPNYTRRPQRHVRAKDFHENTIHDEKSPLYNPNVPRINNIEGNPSPLRKTQKQKIAFNYDAS